MRLAIVGGGAAGIFAAAMAGARRIPALLIERKARLGSKVLMTANGRCNFAKDISAEQFLADLSDGTAYARRTAAFVAEAVRECPPRHIASLVKSLHVPLKRMADGRLFPADAQAATIVHAFGDAIRDGGVPVLTNCAVTGIQPMKNGFIVATAGFTLWAENVLLATGGLSYPKTGSVGDGQNFARTLGHRIEPYFSGLIGVACDDRRVTSAAGRRFENGRVTVRAPEGRVLFESAGEVDCESFGLSGAAVYNAQRFLAHLAADPAERARATGLALDVAFGNERIRLVNPTARPLKEAIVTIGGVALNEVDPHTMESKLVPGLYFAGEMLDIDGPTGGYNLTLAFATARKAIMAVATGRAARFEVFSDTTRQGL